MDLSAISERVKTWDSWKNVQAEHSVRSGQPCPMELITELQRFFTIKVR